MKTCIRKAFAGLMLTALIFSTSCSVQDSAGGKQETEDPDLPPPVTPEKCTVDNINEWIKKKINRKGGPIAKQYNNGKGTFVFKAVELPVETQNPNGEKQTGKYKRLIISKTLIDHAEGSVPPGPARTLPQLNGIIQPLVNWGAGTNGPCVVSVKYVTEATALAPASDDFEWSFCPVGSQICPDGTCSEYCAGGTRKY